MLVRMYAWPRDCTYGRSGEGGPSKERAEIADGPSALMPLMSWEKLKLNSEPELRPQNENAKLAPRTAAFLLLEGRKTVSVSILGNQLLPSWPSVRGPSMHPSIRLRGGMSPRHNG